MGNPYHILVGFKFEIVNCLMLNISEIFQCCFSESSPQFRNSIYKHKEKLFAMCRIYVLFFSMYKTETDKWAEKAA